MKHAIALIIALFAVTAHADKEAAQGRADDCFTELNGMVDATNNANFGHGGEGAGAANRKFRIKKEQCMSAKTAYENNYGKYQKTKQVAVQPTRIVFDHPNDNKKEKMAIAFLKQVYHTKKAPGVPEIEGLICTRQPLDTNVLDGLTALYKKQSGGKDINDISCDAIDNMASN